MKKFGTRREVWNAKARMTTGKLRKKDLAKNKNGKLVSKKKQKTAKRDSNLGSHLTKDDKAKGRKGRRWVNYAK